MMYSSSFRLLSCAYNDRYWVFDPTGAIAHTPEIF